MNKLLGVFKKWTRYYDGKSREGKAELVSAAAILIVSIVTGVVSIVSGGVEKLLQQPVAIIAIVAAVVLFFLPIKLTVKGLLYSAVLLLEGLFQAVGDLSLNAQYMIALAILISGLYYSKKVLYTVFALSVVGTGAMIAVGRLPFATPAAMLNHFVVLAAFILCFLYLTGRVEWNLSRPKKSEPREADSLAKVHATLSSVQKVATNIEQMSGQIAASGESLAGSTTQQAATLEELDATTSHLAERAKTSAENAVNVRDLVAEANAAAEAGGRTLQNMNAEMDEIRQSSRRISSVIKLIDDIAFQTNMLALNAAVEAANAGSYGRGFSVVAEEVRNLAGRSAQAAKETEELIANSQAAIDQGAASAKRAAEAIETVLGIISDVNAKTGLITENSSQIAEAVTQISGALSQLNHVVADNSQSAEGYVDLSKKLLSTSSSLSRLARI